MTQQELVNGLTYLGTAFNKTYTQMECELHYDFLGEYNFDTFVTAIKAIIRKSKFAPKVSELIEECEQAKFDDRVKALEAAKQTGLINVSEKGYKHIYSLVKGGYIPPHIKNELEQGYKLLGQPGLISNTKALKEG